MWNLRSEHDDEYIEDWAIKFLQARNIKAWEDEDDCREALQEIMHDLFVTDEGVDFHRLQHNFTFLAEALGLDFPDVKIVEISVTTEQEQEENNG